MTAYTPKTYAPKYSTDIGAVLSAWGGGQIIDQLHGGHRNLAFLVRVQGHLRVAKRTRRCEAALRWLEPVFEIAEHVGLGVPKLINSQQGRLVEQGWTLETFVAGEPATPQHLATLVPLVQTFHKLTATLPQRPGFCSSQQLLHQTAGGDVDLTAMPPALVDACKHHWRTFAACPQSVVHGDLNVSNVLVTSDGKLVLVDWDEARRDLMCFDTFALEQGTTLTASERALLDAWEVAVSWQLEPDYAKKLSRRLVDVS